jgi:hypothetical protein
MAAACTSGAFLRSLSVREVTGVLWDFFLNENIRIRFWQYGRCHDWLNFSDACRLPHLKSYSLRFCAYGLDKHEAFSCYGTKC